jgi:hypothetical protein
MARLYAVLHCFENAVRALIRETLEEKDGLDWIDKLPQKTKDFAATHQKPAFDDSWLEGEKSDLLGFVDFGQLSRSWLRSGYSSKISYLHSIG